MSRRKRKPPVFNDPIFNRYYNRLCEITMSRFNWLNLPDTIDVRYLEQCLMRDGYAVFFKDEVLGYLALQCMIGGQLNVYRIPTLRRAYATNGYQLQLDSTNSVIIYNNYVRTPELNAIRTYSLQLTEIERAIIVNSKAQKTPCLVLSDEKQREALENIYEQYDGDEPVIFGDKGLGTEPIKSISTLAPFTADKLYDLKSRVWNEALTYLGIPNVTEEKKERMLVDEVEKQNGGTFASRNSCLNMRRFACEEINKMFGLNIDVDFIDGSLEDSKKRDGKKSDEKESSVNRTEDDVKIYKKGGNDNESATVS